MIRRSSSSPLPRAAAFTLLELLAASIMFVVLAAALYSVFAAALHLRERAYASVEQELPPDAALSTLRRDLTGAVIPSGTLAGEMVGTSDRRGDGNRDSLEFYTTTGTIDEDSSEPWGDIQKVCYTLEDYSLEKGGQDRELVRQVTRNLLSPTTLEPETQRLLGGVRSLTFQYLASSSASSSASSTNNSGTSNVGTRTNSSDTWLDSWDSANNNDQAPAAIRARLVLDSNGGDSAAPIEIVCLITDASSSFTTIGALTQ